MTIGNLDYYDGNIYTLTLKDANPTDTYEASLSFKLPASETLQLVSGDYPVSTGSGEMTLDAAKSSWTFIDKENFNDRIKNTIKEGSLTVTNNGNHNYTVTGTLRERATPDRKQPLRSILPAQYLSTTIRLLRLRKHRKQP